jgi:hypothetical protein
MRIPGVGKGYPAGEVRSYSEPERAGERALERAGAAQAGEDEGHGQE